MIVNVQRVKPGCVFPFFGYSYISDRNIWRQFHLCWIFGYELKPISAAIEFSQQSVGIPAGLLKDVKKWGDQLNRSLNKQQQIYLMIQLREKYLGNICTKNECPDKILVFSFFSARPTNIWLIWWEKNWNKVLVVLHQFKNIEYFWVKIECVGRFWNFWS